MSPDEIYLFFDSRILGNLCIRCVYAVQAILAVAVAAG